MIFTKKLTIFYLKTEKLWRKKHEKLKSWHIFWAKNIKNDKKTDLTIFYLKTE